MAAAATSYGQGFVYFSNYYASTQTTGVIYGDGPAVGKAAGPEISAQLWYFEGVTASWSSMLPLNYVSGGNSSPAPLGLGLVSGPGSFGTGAGVWNGGAVLVPGTPGDTYTFGVQFSGTYLGVQYFGESGLFGGTTQSSSTGTIPGMPGGILSGTFNNLVQVPEPTTMALGALGGLSLLLFRRKQA